MAGNLLVVGLGIKFACDISVESQKAIVTSDKVYYLVADPLSAKWIIEMNSNSESLHSLYEIGKPRMDTYLQMVDKVLASVREGLNVCMVSYGHPGVFGFPMHEAVRVAKYEGFHAKMLPGISAAAVLFSDLGIDPGSNGSQEFEATDFLVYNRQYDHSSLLILWQIGVIGSLDYQEKFPQHGLKVLLDVLLNNYDALHKVFIYEASQYSFSQPRIEQVALGQLINCEINPITTLCIPPKSVKSPDNAILQLLGLM
jgi:uncharacterized protein YabN with tetrapyrrole methylase and pyrophosphatase domain